MQSRERALEWLRSHHVMTLATCDARGPWGAAVFYANDGFDLYFLSSPSSRHARSFGATGRAAATVQDDTSEWRKIRGIQLEGAVRELEDAEGEAARRIYGKKFPVADAPDEPAIREALQRVAWYRLRPDRVFYLDNSLGFGHREEIRLRGGEE